MRINVMNDGEYDIPIIPQWEIYRYEPILRCECGRTEHGHNLVGIAEVRGAMMLCHKCHNAGINLGVMLRFLTMNGKKN